MTDDAQHIARERDYLAQIAAHLDRPGDPRFVLTTIPHSGIPLLDFPDHDFGVWAEWEGGTHDFNIVPSESDEFPSLPDGRSDGDAGEAAVLIREYAADRAASVMP